MGMSEADPAIMRAQLASVYERLAQLKLDKHARDFWRMRAAKQHAQVQANALLHEHTAIQQYILWHAEDGSRLPAFMRGGERAIAGKQAKQQGQM